jgi:putative membrane protein
LLAAISSQLSGSGCVLELQRAGTVGRARRKKELPMFFYGSPGAWSWGFGLVSILFWVLLAMGIVALVRSFGRHRVDPPYRGYVGGPGPYREPGPAPGPWMTPEQILAERFARGEINEDEFRAKMEVLRAEAQYPGPPPAPTWRD